MYISRIVLCVLSVRKVSADDVLAVFEASHKKLSRHFPLMCDYYIWQRSFNKQIKLSGSLPFEYCGPQESKEL